MPDKHLDETQIARFVSGELNDAEMEAVLEHVVECDACMERADAAWQKQPVGAALRSAGHMDADKALQMEQKLLRRINRSNLGGAMVGFGVGGFSSVLLALVRPFLTRRNPPHKGTDHD